MGPREFFNAEDGWKSIYKLIDGFYPPISMPKGGSLEIGFYHAPCHHASCAPAPIEVEESFSAEDVFQDTRWYNRIEIECGKCGHSFVFIVDCAMLPLVEIDEEDGEIPQWDIFYRNVVYAPTSRREHYIQNFGFDPVTDRRKGTGQERCYEAWLPLASDPNLHAAGVEIGARVVFHIREEWSRNLIVFRQDGRESHVQCTHTVIWHGSLADWETQHLREISMEKVDITLPPEEHFVVLKSYVAALAEVGLVNLLENTFAFTSNELPIGFNIIMQTQILNALVKIAPHAAS